MRCPFEKLYPSELMRDDRAFMMHAFNQAIDAWQADEVPVGAVITHNGIIIGRSHNQVATSRDPTAHAEIIAITQAATAIGDWRLNETTLYVTKEPCPMCSGAMIMARVGRVVYGISDPKMGCLGGAIDLNTLPRSNHRISVTSGILEPECRMILQSYFAMKRASGSAATSESENTSALGESEC